MNTNRSSQPNPGPRRSIRLGMTLVELLIVVTVILLMVAISVPAVAPSVRENRIREASRQVNVLVARAKARAAELGRRVAIWMERSGPGSNAVIDLYLAEAPPEYSGDLQGARCVLHYDPAILRWRLRFNYVLGDSNSISLAANTTALIKPGENFRIRFDGRGAWFDGIRDAANGQYFLRPPLAVLGPPSSNPPDRFIPPVGFFDPGVDGNWGVDLVDDDGNGLVDDAREAGATSNPATSPPGSDPDDVAIGLPYQIQLIPRRVSASRLQLPEGTAVDLGFSGMGISLPSNRAVAASLPARFAGLEFDVANTPAVAANNSSPVLIVFDPSGEVDSIIYNGTTFEPSGPIHLLVGLFEQVAPRDNSPTTPQPMPWSTVDATNTSYDQNVSDNSTVWVSIGDRTGAVTSAPNGWEYIGAPTNFYESLRRSREFAQQSQTIGGR